MFKENLDMLEYPFLTMSKYPTGFILRVGGTVRANSVKLLERMTNLEEPESRDAWWTELRLEVRSHARALACNVVLGYSEHTAICDDVCVLSASGTAAVINVCLGNSMNSTSEMPKMNGTMSDSPQQNNTMDTKNTELQSFKPPPPGRSGGDRLEMPLLPCRFCHVPYNELSVPFKVNLLKCAVCKKGNVPDLIFATIDPPDNVPITGRTCFIQAFVSRSKRDCKGELNAKEISDGLPFLEYELHRQLMNKLHVKGMNALFGLKVQKCIGERTLAAYATATAVFLSPLPPPALPKVTAGDAWKDSNTIAEMQKMIQDCVTENKEFFRLRRISDGDKLLVSDSEESEEEILPDIDLNAGGKDTCILEMDDAEDISVVSQLMDPHPPKGFHVSSIETLPGLEQLEVVKNLQMFTQVWRSRVPSTTSVNKHFQRLLQTMYYKLRRMTPCAIAKLSFHIDIPEPEEVQLSVVGMALGLGEVEKTAKTTRRRLLSSHSKDLTKDDGTTDLIFRLEEDQNETTPSPPPASSSDKPLFSSLRPTLSQQSDSRGTDKSQNDSRGADKSQERHSSSLEEKDGVDKKASGLFTSHTPPKEHYGVDITPLSHIPGGRIEKYLGNLNFFFIRESNCIREMLPIGLCRRSEHVQDSEQSGGLSGFVHSFVTEVLAILRAHVTALGGNAMVSYTMTHCILLNNQGKNQGQCLINVGGDVVFVSYPSHGSEDRE
uniref:C2 domain-containing protein 5 n=1 Tax=Cacopsylla melanoneura TaxID=428564 RepID=A0A8D8LCW9_9HEMI